MQDAEDRRKNAVSVKALRTVSHRGTEKGCDLEEITIPRNAARTISH